MDFVLVELSSWAQQYPEYLSPIAIQLLFFPPGTAGLSNRSVTIQSIGPRSEMLTSNPSALARVLAGIKTKQERQEEMCEWICARMRGQK